MSSVRELRRRIKSIKNIAKMTKAMQMVASSKMRRAQERVQQSQPYAEQLRQLVARLAQTSEDEKITELELLQQRPMRVICMIVITPDRNLCGALPSNINRKAMAETRSAQTSHMRSGARPDSSFIAVGKRGRDFIVRTEQPLLAEFTNYGDWPALSDATAIARIAVDAFLKQEVDLVLLTYSHYVSTLSQQPETIQLLPIQAPTVDKSESRQADDYLYEPDQQRIFAALLPRYIDIQIYQALLETAASQQSAQMVAMKNATDNANELVQDLTLVMNKARQEIITMQLLEIVAGAESFDR
ncbi:ATP synthase F1 subunit gamma [Dictyobacter kobayashii]|uniref:ATP synthase gamma chain n=1 Tax=Dictyobacter kobayashii TaxID=2014872 RepID=A0A402ATZ6_9CHLR|nr:ATP synthase F1 subunit gamma [Dictyobacter kobayashii]GCE22636.1 ATP synthase gamma chain [Dictyobacter kobayashii]